jgi:hypothetical protein
MESQSTIGWRNLICGRISVEWAHIQDLYITADQFDGRYYSGDTWTVKVIQHIWHALHTLWQLRNETLHGDNFTEKQGYLQSQDRTSPKTTLRADLRT